MKVHEEVLRALKTWGNHPAIIEVEPNGSARALSAIDLIGGITDSVNFLRSAGLQRGTPTALFLENSVEFIQVFLALCRIGAIPSPQKIEYRALELQEIFANSRPGAVITESTHLENLQGFLGPNQTVITRTGSRLHLLQGASERVLPADADEDVASLNYTYRGYGYPLGVEVTHAQYLHGARVLQDGLQGLAGERMLFNLPMSHIFTLVGCILVPLLYGMTVVIARTIHPRLIFRYIDEHRIDYITAIPEIYLLLQRLKESNVSLPTLKAFVSGGSPLRSEEYIKIQNTFAVDVLHGYGLTEFAPASRNIRNRARAGTIGPPCDSIETRIDSPDSLGVGEIQIKSPYLSRRYHRRAQKSEEAFRDGWFMTGDLGRNEDDHLVFVREKKETCKINGLMVDLNEVRRAILLDEEVADADVRKDDNILTARIAIRHRIDIKEKARELVTSLKGILADYKIPKRIVTM